jgi:shikimate kinase
MTHLLVAGIPGTGKTCIGKHLAAQYGFQHVDMEADGVLASFLQNRTAFLGALALNTVVTWGSTPTL